MGIKTRGNIWMIGTYTIVCSLVEHHHLYDLVKTHFYYYLNGNFPPSSNSYMAECGFYFLLLYHLSPSIKDS